MHVEIHAGSYHAAFRKEDGRVVEADIGSWAETTVIDPPRAADPDVARAIVVLVNALAASPEYGD